MSETAANLPAQGTSVRPAVRAGALGRLLPLAAVLLLLAAGLGVRLFDLTDPPIDFHSTRQLRGAIIARGMYYQMLPQADPALREQAIAFWRSTGQYEPSILEKLVAYSYLAIGSENIWVSRIFTSLFWVIGGLALYALAKRLTSTGAALVALAYYLILPFAVQASRSFQPDPGMTMWIVLAVYALYRWSERPSWKWGLAAGILGGMAILTKVVAAYIVGAAAVALVLSAFGIRRFWRSAQVWAMAVLMVAPTLVYYLNREGRASEYVESWTISLSHLLLEPTFYVRWLNLVQNLMGMTPLMLALVGALIARGKGRVLLLALWGGYLAYALTLPYQMYTHNYYHLQLVPIIAISLAPVAQLILDRLVRQPRFLQLLAAGIALVWIVFPAWVSIAEFSREDFRYEPAYWQEIGAQLPTDGKILALTQDYGYRLMYYGWRKVILWPNRGEQALAAMRGNAKKFEDFFAKRTEGKDYFLITAFGQFNDQPELQARLYDNYPVVAEGDGYLIFDLNGNK
jgi:hypothetical protein